MFITLGRPGVIQRRARPVALTRAGHAILAVYAAQPVLDVITEHHRRQAARKAAA